MYRHYLPVPLLLGDTLSLDAAARHHFCHVLRLRIGEVVEIFNDQQVCVLAEVLQLNRKQGQLKIIAQAPALAPSPLAIELAVGVSASKAFSWVLQKSVELGVQTISPLVTDKSLAQKQMAKHDHWMKIIIAACEQSGRCDIPLLQPSRSLAEWLRDCQTECRLVGSLQRATRPLSSLPAVTACAVLMGPAGGFSAAEEQMIADANFTAMCLGQRTLRSETACVAAITLCQAQWGDLVESAACPPETD